MEASADVIRGNVDSLMKLVTALDRAGIELIAEGATSQATGRGVRLKTGACSGDDLGYRILLAGSPRAGDFRARHRLGGRRGPAPGVWHCVRLCAAMAAIASHLSIRGRIPACHRSTLAGAHFRLDTLSVLRIHCRLAAPRPPSSPWATAATSPSRNVCCLSIRCSSPA
jgi:hypothetical protein